MGLQLLQVISAYQHKPVNSLGTLNPSLTRRVLFWLAPSDPLTSVYSAIISPMLMLNLLVFVAGTCIGSFLNVVIDRLPRGVSLSGRSRCENCKKELGVLDLIPLLSYVMLRARCRYCHSSLGLQYPLVELITGITFVFLFNYFSLPISVFWMLGYSILIALFVIDLKYYLLPDILVGSLVVVALLRHLVLPYSLLDLLGAITVSILFFVLIIVTKGKGMGGGDMKLSFPLALLLGWPEMLVGIYGGFFLGGLVALVLIVSSKRKFGQTIPFGPFMILGFILGQLWGSELLQLLLFR